jgi:polyisoprenoid-binding protein YceI
MKTLVIQSAMVLLMLVSSAVSAFALDSYTLDPYHTNVFWRANHFGFSSPSGKFADVSGAILLDDEAPEKSSVKVTIRTDSVITGIEKFDNHLKSPDFFNVGEYPTATFISSKVERMGENAAKVHGALTLLGVEKPVVLDVTLNKIGVNPISHKKTAGFSAKLIIKRSEFGMKYALPGVSDDVDILIEAEANLAE